MSIEIEFDGDEVEHATCPACGGEGFQLGSLGKLEWFRCFQCGTDFYKESYEQS
jgi:tRNA(Ile2) C34 agmatinyltransferase TiaS